MSGESLITSPETTSNKILKDSRSPSYDESSNYSKTCSEEEQLNQKSQSLVHHENLVMKKQGEESDSENEVFIGPACKGPVEDQVKAGILHISPLSKIKNPCKVDFNVCWDYLNNPRSCRRGQSCTWKHEKPFPKQLKKTKMVVEHQSNHEADSNRADYKIETLKLTLENIKKRNVELVQINYKLECEMKELKIQCNREEELRNENLELKRLLKMERLPPTIHDHWYKTRERSHHDIYMNPNRQIRLEHNYDERKVHNSRDYHLLTGTSGVNPRRYSYPRFIQHDDSGRVYDELSREGERYRPIPPPYYEARSCLGRSGRAHRASHEEAHDSLSFKNTPPPPPPPPPTRYYQKSDIYYRRP